MDEKEHLENKMKEAISKADVILTSGGVSMGELDLMQPLLERYGMHCRGMTEVYSLQASRLSL